jgi:hypothetical protein
MYEVYEYVMHSKFLSLKRLQWADHRVMVDNSRVPTNVMRGCCGIRRQQKERSLDKGDRGGHDPKNGPKRYRRKNRRRKI